MKASQPQPEPGDAEAGQAPLQRDENRGSGSGGVGGPREVRESLQRDSLLITRVDGMHSHTCEERIVRAVMALAGVREVEVDFASGQASCIFDARKVSAHQLIGAIEAAGYRCADPAFGSGGGALE